MPQYSYICDDCGFAFVGFASVANRHRLRCPECRGKPHIDIAAQGRTIGVTADGVWPKTMKEFDGTPIEVRSRKHLKELCKVYGMTEVDRAIADRLPAKPMPKAERVDVGGGHVTVSEQGELVRNEA